MLFAGFFALHLRSCMNDNLILTTLLRQEYFVLMLSPVTDNYSERMCLTWESNLQNFRILGFTGCKKLGC